MSVHKTETPPAIAPATRPVERGGLTRLAEELCREVSEIAPVRRSRKPHVQLPSRDAIIEMVEALRGVVFPGYFGTSELNSDTTYFHVGSTLHSVELLLEEQISRSLCFSCLGHETECAECARHAQRTVQRFFERLPAIQKLLLTDVRAAYEGDPAATGPDETILCYPGILAITNYRLAHELQRMGVPLIPRIMTEYAHSITGIDIHPGATIGERFFIDHGTGVVIGETCEIGHGVRVYQGVTLGAKSFPLDEHGNPIKGIKRHPTVEDDVIIYSGATILGRVVIGRGSVIGGNVWLTQSVPAGSVITQTTARRESFVGGTGI